jgi:hypothetical protein
MQKRQTRPSGREFVGELTGLAAGLGMLIFTLAPFALPALALIAVVAVVVVLPVLAGALLAAPFLLAQSWLRSPERPARAINGRSADDELPRFASDGVVGRSVAPNPSSARSSQLDATRSRREVS